MPRQKASPILNYVIAILCTLGWLYILNIFSDLLKPWFIIILFLPVILLIIIPPFVHRRLGIITGHIVNAVSSVFPRFPRRPVEGEREDERSYEQGYQAISANAAQQTGEDLQAHYPELPQARYPELPRPHDPLQQPPM